MVAEKEKELPLPKPQPKKESSETITATVFMYNSEVGQTDDTPFFTANGERVGEGSLGCPSRFKFGTVVEIKGKRYRCNDRMNARYRDGNYFDIWTASRAEAIKFGKQQLKVTIIK